MKGFLHTYLLLLLFLLVGYAATAQNPDAVINRKEILIGEQAIITLSYSMEKLNPAYVEFPHVGDTLVDKVEVIRKSSIDTLETGYAVPTMRLEQKLYITSFDTGYYAIRPLEFRVDGEWYQTPAFLLTVKTVEVDTTAGIMADRGIYQIDVNFMDYLKVYWKYPVAGLILVAIILLTIYFIRKYLENKRKLPPPPPVVPPRPAHEIALESLQRINEEKIFKRGKIKEYHTAITDALRDYIQGRYQISAHELTTRQIMSALRYTGIDEKSKVKLRTVLFRADMVKFAKDIPDETENTTAVNDAIAFVQNTVPELETKSLETEDADA